MNTSPHNPHQPGEGGSSKLAPATPGTLHGEAWLQVHTRQAQRLISGRPAGENKPAIVGLMGFAQLLRPIWIASRSGDPYAHWWLHKIQERLERARSSLQDHHAEITGKLAQCGGMQITLAASVTPVRVPLRFGNPYAFQGAQLIVQLDPLVRATLTAQHVALIAARDAEQILFLGSRAVRQAFASPQGYRTLGITLADVVQGTARAVQARQAMGALPEEFLSGGPKASRLPGGASPPK